MVRILGRLLGARAGRLLGRRYRADRWTTVVAAVLVLLAVPVTVAVSMADYEAETQAAHDKAASGHETVAVLQEDAFARNMRPGTSGFPVQVLATWRTPDGRQHEGRIPAEPELAAGSEVPVWVDAGGQPMAPPRTQGEITATVIATGVWNLVLLELAILGGYWIVLWLIDRARMASWGAEWARVEPQWSRRH